MSKVRQAFFVFMVLFATSVDFIVRQYFPEKSLLVDLLFGLSALLAYLQWRALMSSLPEGRKGGREGAPPAAAAMPLEAAPLHPLRSLVRQDDTLLVVRFFAAFLVFMAHANMSYPKDNPLCHGIWRVFYGGAHTGMCVFFTLSGYLMGKAFVRGRYSLDQRGILDFYQSRFVRIFPLMAFVTLFLGATRYPVLLRHEGVLVLRIFTFNFYGYLAAHCPGLGALWSLSVEFQYYLLAPFMFALFHGLMQRKRRQGLLLVLGVIALLYGLRDLLDTRVFDSSKLLDPNFFSLFGNLPFFLTGFLVNYLDWKVPAWALKALNTQVGLLAVLAVAYLGACNIENLASYSWEGVHTYYAFICLATAASILCLEQLGELRRTQPSRPVDLIRIFQVFGVLSFGFYLWLSSIGEVYGGMFVDGLSGHLSYILETAYLGLIVLGVSLLSYILVEDRFNRYKAVNHRS